MRIRPATIALWTGLAPVLAVHAALALSLGLGLIEPCNPYADGCTSISRAARHGAANVLFKTVMLPYAVLLTAYWVSAARWLGRLDPAARRTVRWLPLLGTVSAAFLVLYTAFLGTDGHIYQLLRRYGVTVYFSFSYLAQLLLAARLHAVAVPFPRWIVRGKLTLCTAVLALGLGNVAGAALLADNDRLENLIEWYAAALMTAFYLLTWRARR